jgi:hypothetical protein
MEEEQRGLGETQSERDHQVGKRTGKAQKSNV